METRKSILTRLERDVLVMAAQHQAGTYPTNSEIAEHLGVSEGRVKIAVHRACIKLGARNRSEAIGFALTSGEMNLTDFQSVDEVTENLSSLSPDMLRRIADLVRQQAEQGRPPETDEPIVCRERGHDCVLTPRERDILTLAHFGLTNADIAARLWISIGAVKVSLRSACRKLGVRGRADAILVAVKRQEIGINEISSVRELVLRLRPLGAEAIEKMAQVADQSGS